jgi:integrase
MPRAVRDPKLTTRSARARLATSAEPYWVSLQTGFALGYRKHSSGGSWIARYYAPNGRPKFRYCALGAADDALEPDGLKTFSYAQAQEKAREWFAQQARIEAGVDVPHTGPYRVRDAIAHYLKWYKVHRRDFNDVCARADLDIIPVLGNIEVRHLTTARIRDWHEALSAVPPRRRRSKLELRWQRPSKRADVTPRLTSDPEFQRRRRASANRVLTILKAALNMAWRDGKAPSDDAWRRVGAFKNVSAPVVRYLTEAECVRLVNACDDAFRPLVRAALLTGCRYGELAALKAGDFNPDVGIITIRTSKSGKARHVVLTDEGQALFRDLTAGAPSEALVFKTSSGRGLRKNSQRRPLADACKRAHIVPRISFHVLRHTHGSTLAMHNVPMAVIARQLGHADTRMTEKHYAHLAPNYVADAIRAGFPKLGIVGQTNLKPLGI